MGLFDSLTSDPDQQRALMQGLLSGAFGAMAGRGSRLQAWGQGGLAGLMGYQGSLDKSAQAKQQSLQNERQALQDQLLRGQIGQQQRQAQIQALPGQFYRAPSMPGVDATGGMDTAMENPANQASPEGRFDMGGYQNALMGLDPLQALQLKAMTEPKKAAPIKGSPGDVFFDAATGKQLFGVPERQKEDEFVAALRAAGVDPASPQGKALLGARVQKMATHAPAASATVITRQETEEAKAVGRTFGEQFAKTQEAGLSAGGKLNRLARLENMMQGVTTGKLAPAGKEIASYLQSVGIKIDPTLGNKEAIEALSNEMALEARNPSGGAGMPGAMSDQDRAFLQNIVPSLSKSNEGNRMMIETQRRLAKRDQDVAKLARDYRKKKGSIDEGFYDELAQWAEKNPLFADMTQTQTGAYSDAEKERRYQEWKKKQR